MKRAITLFILSGNLLAYFLLFTACSPKAPAKPGPTQPPAEEKRVTEQPKVPKDVKLDGVNVGGLTKEELMRVINELAVGVRKEPTDAKISQGDWTITQSSTGISVDMDKTARDVMNAREGSSVTLVTQTTDPSITAAQLQKKIVRVAEFSTPLLNKEAGRVKNIRLAAQSIDGVVVSPGQQFSYNKHIGNPEPEEGYKKAPIIGENNKTEYEVGGGVCQLSTTLFNAADKADMKIIERHRHSKPVPYVEQGRDAMVNYGSADLIFQNTRKYPIMIRTQVKADSVLVWILENRG